MNEIKRASVTQENGKTVVRINASAMSLLHACERKADYILNKGFGLSDVGSLAQNFGKAIHLAMAKYYSLPKEDHTAKIMTDIWAEIPFESDDPKKNKETGAKMLHNYATTYAQDPWTVVKIYGKPAVEIEFEGFFSDFLESVTVRYFGTIDMIVQNSDTGEYAVMDHKTTSSVGKEFLSRWKPNHQMSGYIWAMKNHFKLDTNKAIINGLQVVKTVQNVCRVETHRTEEELEEFKTTVTQVAINFMQMGLAPLRSADSMVCSQWGGCRFLDACATTPSLRPAILESLKLQGGYEYGHAAE